MKSQCRDLILNIYKTYVYKEDILGYDMYMHIKEYRTKNKKTGKIYIKHQLVESYRTQKGPRHRVVMNLGRLKLKKSEWRKLAFALESRLAGQGTLIEDKDIADEAERALKNYGFYKIRKKKEVAKPEYLTIDTEKLATTDNRKPGSGASCRIQLEKAWYG